MAIVFVIVVILLIVLLLKKKKKKVKADLYVFKVAGITYYRETVMRVLNGKSEYEGPCELKKEPDNPADPEAIAIYVNGMIVGHIAKKDHQEAEDVLSKAIKKSIYLKCDDIMYGRVNIYVRAK